MRFGKPILAALFALLASSVQAQVTQTVGAGTAITGVPDRTATFDNVVNRTDLTAYTENNLSITVNSIAFEDFDPTGGSGLGGFSGGFHYPNHGAIGATIIKTTDSMPIFGAEFNVGTGYSYSTTHFAYFVFSGGIQIATGAFDITSGSVLGFSDSSGFDSLQIGAYLSLSAAQGATTSSFQTVAIDNLKVDVHSSGVPSVPEPGSVALLIGMGMSGAGLLVRRRRAGHKAA